MGTKKLIEELRKIMEEPAVGADASDTPGSKGGIDNDDTPIEVPSIVSASLMEVHKAVEATHAAVAKMRNAVESRLREDQHEVAVRGAGDCFEMIEGLRAAVEAMCKSCGVDPTSSGAVGESRRQQRREADDDGGADRRRGYERRVDAINRLVDIQEQIGDMADEALSLYADNGGMRARAEQYWHGHIKSALKGDSFSLDSAIDELEGSGASLASPEDD